MGCLSIDGLVIISLYFLVSSIAVAVATVVEKGYISRSRSILVLISGSDNPLISCSIIKMSHTDFPHGQLKLQFTDNIFRSVNKSGIDSPLSCSLERNLYWTLARVSKQLIVI